MEHLSNDHEDHLSQHKNIHNLCNEMGHAILILLESLWKLRQEHDQNFAMVEKKAVVEQILASEEINESKRARQ